MTDQEELFMVCDDTNNVGFDEIDFSAIPPEVLERMDEAIKAAKDTKLAAA